MYNWYKNYIIKLKIYGLINYVIFLGCGVNLNNSLPTTCINDIIIEHNKNSHDNLKTLTSEQYFSAVFTELEQLLNQIQNGNVDIIFDLYYKYWLHR